MFCKPLLEEVSRRALTEESRASHKTTTLTILWNSFEQKCLPLCSCKFQLLGMLCIVLIYPVGHSIFHVL